VHQFSESPSAPPGRRLQQSASKVWNPLSSLFLEDCLFFRACSPAFLTLRKDTADGGHAYTFETCVGFQNAAQRYRTIPNRVRRPKAPEDWRTPGRCRDFPTHAPPSPSGLGLRESSTAFLGVDRNCRFALFRKIEEAVLKYMALQKITSSRKQHHVRRAAPSTASSQEWMHQIGTTLLKMALTQQTEPPASREMRFGKMPHCFES